MSSIKDKLEQQRNIAKMKIAGIHQGEPVKSGVEDDADVKHMVSVTVKYGIGDDISIKQHENRIKNISEMMLRGYTQREVVHWCTQVLEISSEAALKYHSEAKKDISESWREDFDSEMDWHVATRKLLFKESMKEGGDRKLALLTLDSLAKVQAIYDNKPAINPDNTFFDEASAAETEHDEIIESVQNGDSSLLEQFKQDYKNADRRGVEFKDEDENE